MPIQTSCPECSARFTLADNLAGKKARCKNCQAIFLVSDNVPTLEEVDDKVTSSPRSRSRPNVTPAPAARRSSPARRDEDEEDRPSRRRDEEEERPSRRRRDEEEEARPARRKEKAAAAGGSNNMGVLVGGGVACATLLTVGIIVAAVVMRPRSDSNQQAVNNPQPAPLVPPPPDTNPPPDKNAPPDKYPPPDKNPVKPPDDDPPPKRGTGDGKLSREAMDRVKRATVFLKVAMQGGVASGTGFFGDSDTPNLVLTNAHVVGMMSSESPRPARVEVIINSGEKDEKRTTAKVLGVDRSSDLAVLEIVPVPDLPKPLKVVKSSGHLRELDNVWVFGFPFGESLGKEITIRPSSVSSLRKRGGVLDQIQVNGGMDPGNSGGPMVDENGHVVGVAVAGIPGRMINFAIPGERVHTILNGRIVGLGVALPFKEGEKINLPITMEMLDPRNRIKEVALEVWTGDPPTPGTSGRPPTDSAPAPQPGDSAKQRFRMTYAAGIGKGEVTLPTLPAGKVYWWQPVWVQGTGQSRWASASVYQMTSTPLERKPVDLRARWRAGLPPRRVTLSVTNKLRAGADDDSEVGAIITSVNFSESVLSSTPAGVMVNLNYQSADQRAIIRKRTILSPVLRDIQPSLRAMSARITLDGAGNILKSLLVIPPNLPGLPRNPRERLQAMRERPKQMREFHEPINLGLETTMLPLPNKMVAPRETWKVARGVGIEMPDEKIRRALMDLTCAYVGVRQNGPRQEAVIALEGVVRGAGISGGKVNGTMVVDVAAGAVRSVDLRMKLDMPAVGLNLGSGKVQKINVQSDLVMRLERGL
jgi:S1-C subfamily serine protease